MFSTRRLSFSLRRFLQNKINRGLTSDASPEEPHGGIYKYFPIIIKKTLFLFRKKKKLLSKILILFTDKNIIVVKEGVITIIGINRPSKKNCLDTTTIDELDKALLNFYSDKESKVGIIHGTGGTFCSGYDLNEIAKCEGDVNKIPALSRLVSNV